MANKPQRNPTPGVKVNLDEMDLDDDSLDDGDISQLTGGGEIDPVMGLPDESKGQAQFIEVTCPSGATITVISELEETYFNEISAKYLSHNKFQNISDLQDLDRVLFMELLAYRWGHWLLNGVDYYGTPIDAEELRKAMADYSKELRLLKKSLNMDKASRDRDKGESISEYLENLRVRAREFGVMRNQQAVEAITIMMEVAAMLQLNENADDIEQRELECDEGDIIKWLREDALPRFFKIDHDFRNNPGGQKYWVRSL